MKNEIPKVTVRFVYIQPKNKNYYSLDFSAMGALSGYNQVGACPDYRAEQQDATPTASASGSPVVLRLL